MWNKIKNIGPKLSRTWTLVRWPLFPHGCLLTPTIIVGFDYGPSSNLARSSLLLEIWISCRSIEDFDCYGCFPVFPSDAPFCSVSFLGIAYVPIVALPLVLEGVCCQSCLCFLYLRCCFCHVNSIYNSVSQTISQV